MPPDLETVMAYVDGELPPQRRLEVEAAAAANAELAAMIEALFASRLPYRSAFTQRRMPAVPESLQTRVAELSAVVLASHEVALAEAGGRGERFSISLSTANVIAMVVLLVLGLLLGHLSTVRFGQAAQPVAEPWVMQVGSYHAMYSRETVSDGAGGIAQTRALQHRLHQQNGLALEIPDLTAQGLQFVRAQQLQFDGKMVLQLVYLPRQGPPLALCLTPADGQAERAVTFDGLQAVTWYAKGWAYVLVGSLPLGEMRALRRQIPTALI